MDVVHLSPELVGVAVVAALIFAALAIFMVACALNRARGRKRGRREAQEEYAKSWKGVCERFGGEYTEEELRVLAAALGGTVVVFRGHEVVLVSTPHRHVKVRVGGEWIRLPYKKGERIHSAARAAQWALWLENEPERRRLAAKRAEAAEQAAKKIGL